MSPPGVEARFTPGGERSAVPLVVAVGRLVPVKRFHLLDRGAGARSRPSHPDLRAVIAGEGYERPALEALVRRRGAEAWISLPGYVSDDGLVDLYRPAWVVASTSLREGWGMTVTEAGACGTPGGGHRGSAATRTPWWTASSGLLVDGHDELVARPGRRAPGRGPAQAARASAPWSMPRSFTWDATARGTLAALGAEALGPHRLSGPPSAGPTGVNRRLRGPAADGSPARRVGARSPASRCRPGARPCPPGRRVDRRRRRSTRAGHVDHAVRPEEDHAGPRPARWPAGTTAASPVVRHRVGSGGRPRRSRGGHDHRPRPPGRGGTAAGAPAGPPPWPPPTARPARGGDATAAATSPATSRRSAPAHRDSSRRRPRPRRALAGWVARREQAAAAWRVGHDLFGDLGRVGALAGASAPAPPARATGPAPGRR